MCDTFCVRRPDGMLFAKSSDRPVDEIQILEWLAPRAAPGRATAGSRGAAASNAAMVQATHVAVPDLGAVGVVGSRPTWMWGLEHGVNQYGVAIGNEKVWTIDDPRVVPPALLGMDLVRLGLERGRNADDALDIVTSSLQAHGQGGSGENHQDEPYWSSFLLVDGNGGWVLETSGRSWVARPVGDGAAISNRLTIGTDWTLSSPDIAAGTDWDRWRDPAAPTGLADHRLAATRACVARGSVVTPADAVAALRDHGTGPWGPPSPSGGGGPGGRSPETVPPATDADGRAVPAPPGNVGAAPPSQDNDRSAYPPRENGRSAPTEQARVVQPPPEDVGDDWSGVTVCMHVRDYQCTTASMVADLPAGGSSGRGPADAPIRVWASLGNACTAVFLPVAIHPGRTGGTGDGSGAVTGRGSVVMPEVLGDTEAWSAFSDLGRAVEAPDGAGASALVRIWEVMAPIEDAAWGEADDLWTNAAGPDRWQAAANRWSTEVRSALTTIHATLGETSAGSV